MKNSSERLHFSTIYGILALYGQRHLRGAADCTVCLITRFNLKGCMKMNRKAKTAAFAAGALCALHMLCGGALPASAEGSIQDVYAAMRKIGMPETMVQQAANYYAAHPDQHDAEGMTIEGQYGTYLDWAENIVFMEKAIWNKVAQQYGVDPDKIREYVAQMETETTAPAEETLPGGSTTATTAEEPKKSDKVFINMTAEEKKAYIMAMPEEERVRFLASLTTAERNSIIKQMSTDDKADLMGQFADIGKSLGMNVTVDQIDGNDISYSVRDGEGNLIDSASIGTQVDDTGWDLTVPFVLSAAAVAGSVGGMLYLAGRMRKKEEQDG